MRRRRDDRVTEKRIRQVRRKSAKIKDKSLIMVFTGDGKGKTSAAVTMAFRMAGHGRSAAVVQFMKSPKDFKFGEHKIARRLGGPHFFVMGAGFTWDTNNRALDIETTLKTWETCKSCARSGKYRLVVWDEINYVIDYGFLKVKPVLDFLKKKPPQVTIVLTGRNAKPSIIKIADCVTEMKDVKHHYRGRGIIAQKGIEY